MIIAPEMTMHLIITIKHLTGADIFIYNPIEVFLDINN
jgi:hypothetical protein